MIILLTGTPGVGKTTVAKQLASLLRATHIEMDQLRFRTGASKSTDPHVEDAINWRAYETALDKLKSGSDVILDSTGTSRRYPYLRYALGEYPQTLIRLSSSFPYGKCAAKYQDKISPEKFQRMLEKVNALPADITILVDSQTPQEICEKILAQLTESSNHVGILDR